MGMPLLAAVMMLTQTQQSLSDLGMLWVLVPGTLLKPVLVLLFHQSLLVVSLMSDISIAALLAALAIRYFIWERRRERAILESGGSDATGNVQALPAADATGLTT